MLQKDLMFPVVLKYHRYGAFEYVYEVLLVRVRYGWRLKLLFSMLGSLLKS